MANLQLAQTQLKGLGYAPADTVYFRAIGPNGAQKFEGTLEQCSAKLETLNKQGYGIYFVVNGDGHTDADVTAGRAVFYEHDDLPKEVQIDLWKSLGLPQPTIQIDTGKKSIHSYWVFDHPIDITRWRVLQADLLDFADADRSIKNPSRVMRLAGFTHQKSGGESVVVSNPGKRHSFEYLRSMVTVVEPISEPAPKPTPKPSQPAYIGMDEIPLIKCIGHKHRDLIASGMNEGGRDSTGIAIAMDLIGTEKHLRSIGQRFDGDARSSFEDYCNRCSPPLTGNDVERIWKSAEKSTDGPCLSEDKIQGCIDAYFKRGQSKGDRPVASAGHESKPLTVLDGGNASPKATPEGEGFDISVASEVKRIVDSELPYDEELSQVQDLAKSSGFNSNDIKGRVKALRMAREAADDRQQAAQALPSLIAERNRRLDLKDFLWGDGGALASMFHRRAQEMKMPVEHSFTAFIPTSANFIPSGVETLVQEGFEQPLIFNAMILGATGDGKSHAMKVAIGAAESIERTERERYTLSKGQFDSDLERWNDSAKSERGEKPQKPIERRRIYQNGTRESLMRLHATNPHGLLWAKDEGEGFASSQNQYRSGKGDDVQQGLEDFNGGSYGKDLATDNSSYFIPHRKIQKLGTMHVAQLMKQLEADDFADYRGDLARWLFCAVPFGERKLDPQRSTAPKINRILTQTLKDLYEDLETLEPNLDGYLFDDEAYSVYAAYQHQLRDWCKAEVGSLAAAFPKMEQYCIRLAGWLHIINAKLAKVQPDPSINCRTMVAAIDLTDFYIGQLRLIYASAVPGQALTGLMFDVQQFCQTKAKPLTAGSIRTLSRTLKGKADTATMKQLLAQLVQSGYGQMEGDRYSAFPDPVEPDFIHEYTYVEGD